MNKKIFNAAYAAKSRVSRGIMSANMNLKGTNPILAMSVIAVIGISAYTAKKFVDKATSEKGGEE